MINEFRGKYYFLSNFYNATVTYEGITYKDRLSRVGFELFYHLFKKHNCEIIVMSEVGSQKLDSEEIFEEIVSLLHCYSMKLYSKRKGQKIKQILEESEVNDEDGS